MQAHHGPARWHNLGERHRPSFHVPPVRQHLRSHLVLVWALRLFLEPVSRRSRDSRDASGRHRPGRRGRRRSHPRPWVSILTCHLPVEWPPPTSGEPKRHRRQKNFHAKTIIGHVACLSAHSAGALRGAGDMTLATSAARSARRAMLTLVPRSPCSGPTARDALTASNAFPRSCASSPSSSRPWSTTRGVSTRVVSCGNGDFGRL